MMKVIWQCKKCGRAGAYLTDVVRILSVDPTDPVRDRVKCLGCDTLGTRYEFLIGVTKVTLDGSGLSES